MRFQRVSQSNERSLTFSELSGFDPMLERPEFWSDFHSTFINYWREAIADALPGDYEASIGERVYLVEQDLLQGGVRLPMNGPLPDGELYYFVSRAEQRPDCQDYFWSLLDRLPILPVPLKAPEADILIDLQAVFDTTYQRGRFARRMHS